MARRIILTTVLPALLAVTSTVVLVPPKWRLNSILARIATYPPQPAACVASVAAPVRTIPVLIPEDTPATPGPAVPVAAMMRARPNTRRRRPALTALTTTVMGRLIAVTVIASRATVRALLARSTATVAAPIAGMIMMAANFAHHHRPPVFMTAISGAAGRMGRTAGRMEAAGHRELVPIALAARGVPRAVAINHMNVIAVVRDGERRIPARMALVMLAVPGISVR